MRFAVVLALLVFRTAVASACDCAPPPPVAKAVEAAAAVFLGEVVKLEETAGQQHLVSLKVENSWKGIGDNQVTVSTAKNGATCGYSFRVGKRYLVYAHAGPKGGPLHVSLCSRTRTAEEAEASEDFKLLGDGKAARDRPLRGLELRLEIDEKRYDPTVGSKGKLRAVLKNGSAAEIKVPADYDGEVVQLLSGSLHLTKRSALVQAAQGKKVEVVAVAPGKEATLFEIPLDDLLMEKKAPAAEWRWDWQRRPAPPLSPIRKTRDGQFVEQATFLVELSVNGAKLRSNLALLAITAPKKD
jgi:hypothetical protein